MSDPRAVRVTFGRPSHGWLPVEIGSASATFSESISNVPYADCLADLVTGLLLLWRKPTELVLRWNTEPVEYELRFDPAADDALALRVLRFATRRPDETFAATAPRRDLVLVFWRALRKLESELTPEDIAAHWPRFPTRELASLTTAIRASKPTADSR